MKLINYSKYNKEMIMLIVELIFTILIIIGVFSYMNYKKKQCIDNGGTIVQNYGKNAGFGCITKEGNQNE